MEQTENKESEKLLLEFVALLVHDLETPLVVARQFVKRVRENRYDAQNPAHQELCGATERALDMAERIVYDLMEVAKAQTHKLLPNLTPVSLTLLLKRELAIARVYAEEMGVKIDFQKNEEIPDLLVIDEHLTQRILDNLLTNAIRHSPQNETIKVKVAKNEGYLGFTVTNKPQELKPENLQDIFEPFEQVQQRVRKHFHGVGLGLTFAKLAAQAQGGDIYANFNKTGEVEFSLILPFREDKT